MEVLLLAAALAGAYYLSAKDFIKNARFKLGSVKFNKDNTAQAYYTRFFFTVSAAIENPSTFQLRINSINIAVTINGKLLARLYKVDSFVIDPKKETKILSTVGIDPVSLFSGAVDIIDQLKQGNVKADVQGIVSTAIGNININQQVTVQL